MQYQKFTHKELLVPFDDNYFMKKALAQAEMALDCGEVPIGAVIVAEGEIISQTHNQTEILNDATAHAEILAITAAENALGTKYLSDCTLFVTLEPCVMCAGALFWTKIGTIVYAAKDSKFGVSHFTSKHPYHPKTLIKQGSGETESLNLLKVFFKERR